VPSPYQRLTGPFPFSGDGRAFYDFQPYLGGTIRLVKGVQAANGNFQISHTCRKIPRAVEVLDSGTVSAPSPLPRGTSAWTFANVFVNLPAVAAGQTLVLLVRP
jgi:hypothetical protein